MNVLLNSVNNMSAAAAGAAAGAFAGIFICIILLVAVFSIVCKWIVYVKAGKPGWAVLIPIYNFIVLLEIVGKPWCGYF